MSDPREKPFRIIKVRSRHVDRAQRYALSTLTGSANKEQSHGKTEIAVSTQKLIKQWRARVYELRTEGWSRPTGKSLAFTLNCPPVGVETDQKTLPCNQYSVCPFCWCRRYVAETYNRLERAYFSKDKKHPLKFDLLEVKTTEFLPTCEWSLRGLLEFIKDHRKEFLQDYLPNEGAFQLYSIEPPDPRSQSKDLRWKFQQRILAMIDPLQDDPPKHGEYIGQSRTIHRHNGVTRKKLGMTVGRICLYPAQMMRGPKAAVVDILELKRNWGGPSSNGFRMSGYYGCLRNSTTVRPDERDEIRR